MPTEQELIAQRYAKLEALQQAGADPFAIHRFDRTHTTAQGAAEIAAAEGQTGEQVDWETVQLPARICGRIMAKRDQGKAIWADLHDGEGKLQLWVRKDVLGERFAAFQDLDLGDIVGCEGELFRTRRGEPSLKVEGFTLLSKALRPLPEKWHGLQDPETRYRQRYVDLMVNDEVRELFQRRSRAVSGLRRYLDSQGFLEVETPIMQALYGGAAAKPFITHHNALDMDLYLRIAPELYLKRLLVGGLERVYEIGRMFRNEGVDTRHNPEFTMVEAYQAYTDVEGMMRLTEGMLCALAEAANGSLQCTYRGMVLDLTPPWARISLLESVQEATGIDFGCLTSDAEAREACKGLDLGEVQDASLAGLLDKAFERYVQPRLVQPTFVMDYPVIISPLAKRKAPGSELTARFEAFVGTEEVANAFSELNDPVDQRRRFEAQVAMRAAGDDEAHPMDEDYLRAMEYGLPPAGGMGMGIDRAMMVLCDRPSLREVILFPHLRPEG